MVLLKIFLRSIHFELKFNPVNNILKSYRDLLKFMTQKLRKLINQMIFAKKYICIYSQTNMLFENNKIIVDASLNIYLFSGCY